MTSTVLVLGAAGRLGQCVASAFADAGWHVRAQSRKPLPATLIGRAQLAAVQADALDAVALRQAARGADVIVNALNPPYTEWDRLALPLGDAALALAKASGALLLFPGNVYNFGREIPPRVDRSTPERGDTPKARTRIEMESRLGAAAAQGVRSVVIRAGDFYGGPGPGSWFDLAMTTRLGKGVFVYPGALDLPHAWAYLPDLARVFVRVAEQRDTVQGHRRLLFAGHTATGADWQAHLEALTGRTLKAATLPWPLIRLASPFVPMWRELAAMRYLWQRPHMLDDAELRALIGPVPQTSMRESVAAALAEAAPALLSAPRSVHVAG